MQRISIKELRRFFNRQFRFYDLIKSLTDHRKKYEIPLSHIFYALFYTTILSINNLLSKDKILRKKYIKRFIGSKRKMVASDSTLERSLSNNLETKELKQINQNVFEELDDNHLIEPKLKRKCAIIDGTYLGGFIKEALFIPGKTDYILNFNTIPKRGKELVSAKRLLIETNKIVGKGYFDLVLGDGLYYTQNMFRLCKEELGCHLLVKISERLNVIKDAEGIISGFPNQVQTTSGYDYERLVKYTVKVVNNIQADTIDYPLQIAIVEEEYIKDNNRKEIFYVITSDLDMTPDDLRYAAHLRWRIENNGFKELNNLYETKRKYSKNETCFTNLLWIIILSYNLFHLYLNNVDLSKIILKSKSVLKDWIYDLLESLIEDYYDNSS